MVGDIFVFGFLVIPPVAAMLLANRVRSIFVTSAIIGAVSPVIGLYLAFEFDFPSSPIIVAVASMVLLVAWVRTTIMRS
jgi:iron/zinc/copper transport system permease protein